MVKLSLSGELGAMAAREVEVILSLGVALLLVACAAAYDTANFTYSGAHGPGMWGSLSPQYRLCSEGKRQSPVKIVNADAEYNPELIRLSRNYRPSNATLVDNRYNIALRYDEDVGYVVVEGKKYSLIQMHWHSPSEHTIDGERFPVELHLVHKSVDSNITVVAVLYQFGRADPFLTQLKDKMAELKKEVLAGDKQAHVPVGIVKMRSLKQHARKYYRYIGSLTTPPCTENVVWNVLGKARKMSRRQAVELQAPLEAAYRRNARPAQALNGRVVQIDLQKIRNVEKLSIRRTGHNINLKVSCLTKEFSNLKNIDHEPAHELAVVNCSECITIKGKEMNNEFNYDASDISLEAYICHLQTQNIHDF